jgi:hypothetical protein
MFFQGFLFYFFDACFIRAIFLGLIFLIEFVV